MSIGPHCIKCHHYPCHEPPLPCGRDPTQLCSSIPCPNRCGQGFHECLREEHLQYMCPLQNVPCINAQYGCPELMPRWQIGMHLVKCPASVVHCPVLWHRRVFPSNSQPATDMHQVSLSWNEAATSHFSQALKLSDMHVNACVREQNPPKLQLRKTPGDKPDTLLNPKLVDDDFFFSQCLSDAFLKRVNIHTFYCDCILRRDEYAAHMAIHSDCQNALDDWIEQPCPLKYLGCTFTVPRLIPLSFGHCLRLLRLQRTFSWTLAEGDLGVLKTEVPSDRHILDLPYHVWKRIVYYLDSGSLLALSLVSTELEHLVWQLASHRAMVYPSWSKRQHSCEIRFDPQWALVGEFIWKFSTVPSVSGGNIVNWKLNSHVSERLLRHLAECPFYQKLEYSPNPVLVIKSDTEAFRDHRIAHQHKE